MLFDVHTSDRLSQILISPFQVIKCILKNFLELYINLEVQTIILTL